MEQKKFVFYSQDTKIMESMQNKDFNKIKVGIIENETLKDIKQGTEISDFQKDGMDVIEFGEIENKFEQTISSKEAEIEMLMQQIKQKEQEIANLKLSKEKIGNLINGKFERKEPTQEQEKSNESKQETKAEKEPVKEKVYVRFTSRQILKIFDHPKQVGRDGKPLQMASIAIPSKDRRVFRFGVDKNGFDRDNIVAYWTTIKGIIRTDKDKDGNLKKNGKRYLYLDNDENKKVYKVRFYSQKNEKGQFVEPEPIFLSGKELAQIYHEQHEISKEKNKNKDPNLMLEEEQQKEKKVTQKKNELER